MFGKGFPKESFLAPSPSLSKDDSQQQLNEDVHKLEQTICHKSIVIEAYNGHTTNFLDNKFSFVNDNNKPISRVAQLMVHNFPKTYFLLSILASFLFFPVGFYAIYQSRKVNIFH